MFRLVWIAKRCGPQALDDVDSFDNVIGRNRFAELDSGVLGIARRIVKAKFDRPGQVDVLDSKASQNVG